MNFKLGWFNYRTTEEGEEFRETRVPEDKRGCLITGPRWKGTAPQGIKQISSPDNSVLVLGRVLVYSDSDLAIAYDLSKQIQITPLSQ